MLLIGLDLSRPELSLPLGIGVTLGMAAFMVSSWLILRHKKKLQRPKAPEQPEHDPFTEGSLSERRVGIRRKGIPVGIDIRVGDEEVCSAGSVVNRSTGGLCLRSERPFEVGTVLRVRAQNAPQMTPWTDAEVRSCRKQDDEWEIGCQFVRTPPWSILLLFG